MALERFSLEDEAMLGLFNLCWMQKQAEESYRWNGSSQDSNVSKKTCWRLGMEVKRTCFMGGVWKRQIKSVRTTLSALLKTYGHLDCNDESMMIETEAIINFS